MRAIDRTKWCSRFRYVCRLAMMLPDIWKQSHPDAIRWYHQEESNENADRKQLRATRRPLLINQLKT